MTKEKASMQVVRGLVNGVLRTHQAAMSACRMLASQVLLTASSRDEAIQRHCQRVDDFFTLVLEN